MYRSAFIPPHRLNGAIASSFMGFLSSCMQPSISIHLQTSPPPTKVPSIPIISCCCIKSNRVCTKPMHLFLSSSRLPTVFWIQVSGSGGNQLLRPTTVTIIRTLPCGFPVAVPCRGARGSHGRRGWRPSVSRVGRGSSGRKPAHGVRCELTRVGQILIRSLATARISMRCPALTYPPSLIKSRALRSNKWSVHLEPTDGLDSARMRAPLIGWSSNPWITSLLRPID